MDLLVVTSTVMSPLSQSYFLEVLGGKNINDKNKPLKIVPGADLRLRFRAEIPWDKKGCKRRIVNQKINYYLEIKKWLKRFSVVLNIFSFLNNSFLEEHS